MGGLDFFLGIAPSLPCAFLGKRIGASSGSCVVPKLLNGFDVLGWGVGYQRVKVSQDSFERVVRLVYPDAELRRERPRTTQTESKLGRRPQLHVRRRNQDWELTPRRQLAEKLPD